MSVYPKAKAPVTENVLAAANARAERWKVRAEQARARVAAVETLADEWERHGLGITLPRLTELRAALETEVQR